MKFEVVSYAASKHSWEQRGGNGERADQRHHRVVGNTHSHDNPASDTVPVPKPDEFIAHLAELEELIEDFKTAKITAEAARPQRKLKKWGDAGTDDAAKRGLPPGRF
jgi:hypothetical protein